MVTLWLTCVSMFQCSTPPGTLAFIDSSYHITLYPPNPYTNEPVPIRPISYLHLSGLLNMYVIRRLRRENWIRIFFRILFPFFLNDHFPSDYCDALRHGKVSWVIMGSQGLQGGEAEDGPNDQEASQNGKLSLESSGVSRHPMDTSRRFSVVNVQDRKQQ